MTSGQLTNRTLLVIVSIITLILLLGSTFLERIVFKAEQVYSPLYLEVDQARHKLGDQVSLKIMSDLSSPTFLSGAQLAITYDSALVSLDNLSPSPSWQTVKEQTNDGQLSWALQLGRDNAAGVLTSGQLLIGQATFTAKQVGVVNFHLIEGQSILAAVDQDQGLIPYNAASSLQSVSISISTADAAATSLPTVTATSLNTADQLNEPKYSAQRVVSSQVLPLANSAVVLTRLQYVGKVRVDFGLTDQLGTSVESLEASAWPTLKLSGLTESTRYYYKLTALDSEYNSQISSNIQSFTTSAIGIGPVDSSQSQVIAYPPKASSQADVLVLLRNSQGQPLTDLQPTLSVAEGEATLSTLNEANGLYQAQLTASGTEKQLVKVRLNLDAQKSIESYVLFDPNYQQPTLAAQQSFYSLAWNNLTLATVLALVGSLVLLGWLFFRLLRSR